MKQKIWLVALLSALTLIGHWMSDRSDALPAMNVASAEAGRVSLSARLDRAAVLQGSDGRVKMEVVLAAAESERRASRLATDFVVVLDRSGSMAGEKFQQARGALAALIDRLLPDDRLAVVAYANESEMVIAPSLATPAARERWLRILRDLMVGGGTNMSGGLDGALEVLQAQTETGRARRLILISDGLANGGDPSFEGLTGRAREASRREAVVTTIGVGADFDEFLMSSIADAGTGNYYFLDGAAALAGIFSRELDASRETVARAVAVSIEPGSGVRVVDAGGYPLEVEGGRTTFHPGDLFAGQERRIWVTLAVPTGEIGERELGSLHTAFAGQGESRVVELAAVPRVACVADRARFAAAVNQETWSRSVTGDAYGGLQQRVARHVREGRRDDALREIRAYQAENAALNAYVGSEEVELNLREADALAAHVEEAFTGADQAGKQNRLSKSQQAAGWDGRRVGSKKLPVVDPGKKQ